MLNAVKNKLAALRAAPSPVNELLERADDCREQAASLKVERDRVARAPRPTSEILDLLDDHLDQLATAGVDALRLGRLTRRDQPVMLELPHHIDKTTAHVDASPATRVLLGIIIATSRPALREVLVGQINDLTRGQPGLTDHELAARLAVIDAEIMSAELAEEFAVRQLEQAGVSVLRRADASPLAVLAHDSALPTA